MTELQRLPWANQTQEKTQPFNLNEYPNDQGRSVSQATTMNLFPIQDGNPINIRPIRPDDLLLIEQMHQRLSLESVYYRYLQYRIPTLDELSALCDITPTRGVALVATTHLGAERIVGLACYIHEIDTPDATAEVGILVEDHFQGQGLGRMLWQQLHQHAQNNQIKHLRVLFDPTNYRVLRLIKGSGYRYETSEEFDLNQALVTFDEPALKPSQARWQGMTVPFLIAFVALWAIFTFRPLQAATQDATSPVVYVAPTGNDAGACEDRNAPCQTILYANVQVADGGEIRVAAGIYPEFIQIMRTITMTGGFSPDNWDTPNWQVNQTILDGQHNFRPLTINADNVKVDGFIVRNGDATKGFHNIPNYGGGIFIGTVNQVWSATLVNLRIENNIASTFDSGYGGGLEAEMGNTFGAPTSLVISNVTFYSNTATTASFAASGGAMSLQAVGRSSLNVEMHNVVVDGNTAGNDFSSGGGGIFLRLNGGTATVSQSEIRNNRAARVETATMNSPSRGGGVELNNGTLKLVNVVMSGNSGERGDAVWVEAGFGITNTLSMNYVTLADNYRTIEEAGSAIRSGGVQVSILLSNTLISGNSTAIETKAGTNDTELVLQNVLVDDNVETALRGKFLTTDTALRGSAAYVDAAQGDYHLTAQSDAIDQGNGEPPLIDKDGVSRPQGTQSEIGAYEFTPIVKADQAITFAAIPNQRLSEVQVVITASATSGLTVTFTSATPGVCTVIGNVVTLRSAGNCSIKATQAGNEATNLALPVVRTFAVLPNVSQLKIYLPFVRR
ncbi:MAG: GNAT family N-acetyltransferase [Caldilineaceae bacterium]